MIGTPARRRKWYGICAAVAAVLLYLCVRDFSSRIFEQRLSESCYLIVRAAPEIYDGQTMTRLTLTFHKPPAAPVIGMFAQGEIILPIAPKGLELIAVNDPTERYFGLFDEPGRGFLYIYDRTKDVYWYSGNAPGEEWNAAFDALRQSTPKFPFDRLPQTNNERVARP